MITDIVGQTGYRAALGHFATGVTVVIERAGRFCVNVLTYAQREISAVFGTAGADTFAAVPW